MYKCMSLSNPYGRHSSAVARGCCSLHRPARTTSPFTSCIHTHSHSLFLSCIHARMHPHTHTYTYTILHSYLYYLCTLQRFPTCENKSVISLKREEDALIWYQYLKGLDPNLRFAILIATNSRDLIRFPSLRSFSLPSPLPPYMFITKTSRYDIQRK